MTPPAWGCRTPDPVTLKHEFGLAFLRVRGIERVRLHADLTMLSRLALALSRVREASLRS
jgi:hypothetical protein